MKGLKKKMTNKAWREFFRDIIAGIFGGIIILAWSLAYETLRDEPIIMRIILPSVSALVLLIILTFFLRYFLLENKK